MIVAVLDTNVLASGVAGAARPESTPGELIRRWRTKQFTLVVSEPILTELTRTLSDPYFQSRLSPAQIASTLAEVSRAHVQSITTPVSGIATHPEDDLILATAVSAGARYLVTGDQPLLQRGSYAGTLLVPPRQFLQMLEQPATSEDSW